LNQACSYNNREYYCTIPFAESPRIQSHLYTYRCTNCEGNTYNFLETERLIRFGQEDSGKDRKEAVMILNHKEAIQYVVEHLGAITISRQDLFNIHALLANGLLADLAMAGRLRHMPVGITHSSFRPPGDQFVIEEEFGILIEKTAAINDPFEQSFFLLVHIPYLQAFDDINKRTSRIAANIPLLKADLAPMPYLTMDDNAYIEGLIGIYELNNVSLLREVYIDAYMTSAENYGTLRAEVETPEKTALVYRDFVREAGRRSVLEWKAFRPALIMAMTTEAGRQVRLYCDFTHLGSTAQCTFSSSLPDPRRCIENRWFLADHQKGLSV